MKKIFFGRRFIVLWAIVALQPLNAEIYRWVDSRGEVHYASKATTRQPVEKIETDVSVYQGKSSAAKKSAKKVVMYSTSWCGVCKKARSYFKAEKIAFKEYDIEKSKRRRREYDRRGGNSVPLIIVGEEQMSGFSQRRFLEMYEG